MITLPYWTALLFGGLLPVVGLACYWCGWRLRGCVENRHRAERLTRRTRSRPMTTQEEQHFQAAFGHMGRVFDEVDKLFGRKRR